jgi:pilus assembly protein TadC
MPPRAAARGVAERARRGRRRPGAADPALLLDLVAVALGAGAPVPTAVTTVGAAWPGPTGEAMCHAARALVLGAPWDVAWAGVSGAARTLADALEPAWRAGASPVPLLRAAADRVRSRRRAAARTAAGRLGVGLVVPLGLCFLPAFVLIGLVPVVLSLAAGVLG